MVNAKPVKPILPRETGEGGTMRSMVEESANRCVYANDWKTRLSPERRALLRSPLHRPPGCPPPPLTAGEDERRIQ